MGYHLWGLGGVGGWGRTAHLKLSPLQTAAQEVTAILAGILYFLVALQERPQVEMALLALLLQTHSFLTHFELARAAGAAAPISVQTAASVEMVDGPVAVAAAVARQLLHKLREQAAMAEMAVLTC